MRSGSGGSNGSSSSNAWRTAAAAPLSNYEFDFGNLSVRSGSGSAGSGSGSSSTNFSFGGGKSTLNSLKQGAPASSSPSFVPSWAPQAAPSQPQQQQQPWVHKPAVSGLSGASSMVGDISGKSWVPLETVSKSKNSNSNSSSIGVVGGVGGSKADLFSDLLKTPSARNTTTNLSSSNVAMNKGISMKDAANTARAATTAAAAAAAQDDLFGDFMSTSSSSNTYSSPPPPAASNMFNQRPSPTVDPFPKPAATQQQPKPQDPLEDLWRKIPTQKPVEQQKEVKTNNPTSDDWMAMDDWASPEDAANTTELEGLPPPPAGVNGAMAKDKGIEFKQQGQFADAIKWLTWSVVLFEGKGAESNIASVLSCRASCYKEVGEYRKAVDDCCKVLEIDSTDTEILLQRAFLYESMEKYKLSVKDLREVLQRDPSNRLARNTLSRLTKLVD